MRKPNHESQTAFASVEERAARAWRLPHARRVAFAAACAEHVLRPRKSQLDHDQMQCAQSALDYLWKFVELGYLETTSVRTRIEQCESVLPDTEENDAASAVLSVLSAIISALELQLGSREHMKWLLAETQQAVEFDAYIKRDFTPEPTGVTAESLPKFSEYPEVREEVRYQLALLDKLESSSDRPIRKDELLASS
jgi:hypothetical protein